jgi:tripartite-type tricarboxylate transporter receptor subunit TctC
MKRIWFGALCAAIFAWHGVAMTQATAQASAQSWPTKPLRVVVPFSPGSATDIIARAVFDKVSTSVGQPVVVENKVGAGGTLGMAEVARAEPDGHTILFNSSSHTVTPATYSNLPFDTLQDFAAIIPVGNLPNVLIVSKTKGYNTLKDLVAAAKAKPGSLNYGSAGPGSASHLTAERLRLSGGFDAVHVPFKGAPEALREVVADRIDFYFSPLLPARSLLAEGQVKAIAVSSNKRSAALKDVPTTVEAGAPNSDYEFWIGVFVPAKTPKAVQGKLHAEIRKALDLPEIRERMVKLGADPMPMTAAEFDALVRNEVAMNQALVKAAGVKAN